MDTKFYDECVSAIKGGMLKALRSDDYSTRSAVTDPLTRAIKTRSGEIEKAFDTALQQILSDGTFTDALTRIRQMDWAIRAEGCGNAADIADSFFHPSGPSSLGYLIQRKNLI